MRKLGVQQQGVLRSLRRNGSWHRECAWVWDGLLNTERCLERLVELGYARKVEETDGTRQRVTFYPVETADFTPGAPGSSATLHGAEGVESAPKRPSDNRQGDANRCGFCGQLVHRVGGMYGPDGRWVAADGNTGCDRSPEAGTRGAGPHVATRELARVPYLLDSLASLALPAWPTNVESLGRDDRSLYLRVQAIRSLLLGADEDVAKYMQAIRREEER